MKKIIVIGCPGSGKSTFSTKLNSILNIPLYHLDMLYWNSDKTTVGREIFLNRLEIVLKSGEWILDGNYISTMQLRLDYCDTVIFLDYSTEVCLDGIEQRKNKPRSDMPWVEKAGEEDLEFLNYIKNFNQNERTKILNLLKNYSQKRIITFKNRAQSDEFLNELTSLMQNSQKKLHKNSK